jgi:hypothetical protein
MPLWTILIRVIFLVVLQTSILNATSVLQMCRLYGTSSNHITLLYFTVLFCTVPPVAHYFVVMFAATSSIAVTIVVEPSYNRTIPNTITHL